MKKFLALILTFAMVFLLAACGGSSDTDAGSADNGSVQAEETGAALEPCTLTVFAAASMTDTLTELGAAFEEAHPGVTVEFNFDSSGTLKTQIEEGAVCDVFISAAQKQMDQLDINASEEVNTDGLDFVLEGTRFDILENKVVLVVPEGNPANINSIDDMLAGIQDGTVMLGMGNSDVPCGQYTQKIFEHFGVVEEDVQANITYGTNVREITTQVSEGSVDCGVVYATDACSVGLTVVDTAAAEMCGQVIYPAAVINTSANVAAAQAFLQFITTEEASAVFEAVGFTPLAG